MGYDIVRASDASPRRIKGGAQRGRRKPRARCAFRLRLDLVEALDRYVARRQKVDDRVTRTALVEKAIKAFLREKGAI